MEQTRFCWISVVMMLSGSILHIEGNIEPIVQWWSTTRSTETLVRINAAYADGINYTQADQFEWTLPDFSTLTPGNSVAGFEALVGELQSENSSYTHYELRVADGTQWDGSDVEFTASGPPNEGQTDRWSKTFSYEIKKDAREVIELPLVRSLENEYRQDGSVLIQKNLTGGVPEEDKVQWIWQYPSFTISPGEKSGDFSALQKVVGEDNSRIYGLEIKKGAAPNSVYNYVLFIAAEGKWSQRSTEVFFPRDDWRNTDSTTSGGGSGGETGDGGKNSAVVNMNYEMSVIFLCCFSYLLMMSILG